ncbi:hypothetical protein DSUL_60099 [Desulfovibrionales bacterium]
MRLGPNIKTIAIQNIKENLSCLAILMFFPNDIVFTLNQTYLIYSQFATITCANIRHISISQNSPIQKSINGHTSDLATALPIPLKALYS